MIIYYETNLLGHKTLNLPIKIKLHCYALPPLTTEDHVLLRAGEVVDASADAHCDKNSTPGRPVPRHEGTLCALGVLWDFGDILGGPIMQSIMLNKCTRGRCTHVLTPHYSIRQYTQVYSLHHT